MKRRGGVPLGRRRSRRKGIGSSGNYWNCAIFMGNPHNIFLAVPFGHRHVMPRSRWMRFTPFHERDTKTTSFYFAPCLQYFFKKIEMLNQIERKILIAFVFPFLSPIPVINPTTCCCHPGPLPVPAPAWP